MDNKSNEITAIPRLLEVLELTGAIVTIDAIGCQKEIAVKVRQRRADYVLAVKDNQPHLHEDLSDHFDRVLEDEEVLPRTRRRATKEKNRRRLEHRTYIAAPVPGDLRNREAWCDLRSVGRVVSVVQREGKGTVEVRYFISSLKPNARVIALQVVPAVRICVMSLSFQPAVRPLTRRLACVVPSCAIRFIASRRSKAKFSAAFSKRARDWSSWKTTSNTQCWPFSIPQ